MAYRNPEMSDELSIPETLHIYNIEVDTAKMLGRGSYGVVYEAYYHGAKVAVKKLHSIFFDDVSTDDNIGILKSWKNELQLMSKIFHPNIVQFYGVYNSENENNIQLSGSTFIVSELMDKSLRARNLEMPKLNYNEIINILHDIASGLCYLHMQQPSPIMHRDLASKNVLLTRSGRAKIADLGVAKIVSQKQESLTRHPGTDAYMPVEAIAFENDYDCSIDVYALGVIGLELGIGRDPTATQCLRKVGSAYVPVEETERRKVDFADLKSSCNVSLNDFILQCLKPQESRITANVALKKLKDKKVEKASPLLKSNTDDSSSYLEQNRKLKEEISKLQEQISKLLEENSKLKEQNNHLEKEKSNWESRSVENHDKLLTLYKKQDVDRQPNEIKREHSESFPKKPYISRDPTAVTEPHGHSNKPSSLVAAHGSLVIPGNPGRNMYSTMQPTFGHSAKTQPSSTIVTGSSHPKYVTQRSHSEDNCLSGEIKFPPPLPNDSHLDILKQYSRQIDNLFINLREASSALQMAEYVGKLKNFIDEYQRFSGNIPKHIENPEIHHLLTQLDKQIELLKKFKLHQIPINQIDKLSKVARILQMELMNYNKS